MFPWLIECLEQNCLSDIQANPSTLFNTPLAEKAAETMWLKLNRYKETITIPLKKLAIVLDPSTSNFDFDMDSMKDLIYHQLVTDYHYTNKRGAQQQE